MSEPPDATRVALVTGGAVRVGRAITLGLAGAGYDVVVHYHSSEDEAREVVAEVERSGRRARAVQGDVSRKGDVDALLEAVRREHGRLDVLVNSASIFLSTPFLDVGEDEWDAVLGVNLKGPFMLIQGAAELLAASRGHVVNIVDLSALRPWAGYPHHSVAKAGLLHLTYLAARVLAPDVRVNAIAPGAVLPPDDYSEEDVERAAQRSVLGRWGSPEDVVRTVLFLDASPFVTGEVIVVDGGRLDAR